MQIGGYNFERVCTIEPLRDGTGVIVQHMPQAKYANARGLALNKYGHGPFCKFKVPRHFTSAGVYAIVSERGEIKYIGECENLSDRYNMGYGIISPRNCFKGGQETNCRLNNLIFHAVTGGEALSLWFFKTDDYKGIERQLRAALKPQWNRI